MSQLQQQSLSRKSFLTVANNILFKAVLDAARTDAKNLFKAVEEGKRVALMTVRMENNADVRFELSLDCSEFRGRLNYGSFRSSLGILVASISQHLEADKEVPVFTEQAGNSMLFGVTGPTEEDGEVNVLMLAADVSRVGAVHLRLQYMDPEQFQAPASTG